MKKILMVIVNKILSILKINDKQIIFQSGRSRVDCAPFAIYDYIIDNYPEDFRCIWLVDRNTDVSMLRKGDYYYYNSLKGLIALSTSKYWIRSQSIGSIAKKKKNQVYIQTWHGAGNFKKCGFDCDNLSHNQFETMDHAKEWDWIVATDKFNEEFLRSSMGFKKHSIILGNADTDILIHNNTKEYKEKVLEKLNIKKHKTKIIMYAPTFRDFDLGRDNQIDIPIFKLAGLNDCLILLRLHPLVSSKMNDVKLPNNFVNVGWYPNILDLYLITDLLITDYSSIIFPYMLLEKQLIMYPYDFNKYVDLRGGFYLNYQNDLPGPIARDEDELFKITKDIDKIWKKYSYKVKEFNTKYNSLNDGKVCERFISELKKGTFNK